MSEATWSTHLRSLDLPEVEDPGGRCVVVSAHPDDEVLGLGAWLAGQAGRDLRFVVATDGESSHPGSPTVTPNDLRTLRRVELREALTALGHDRPDVRHLRLPDAALPTERAALVDALTDACVGASLVLAPYDADGHGDHDVCGSVAREVLPAGAVLWQYPIWRWEWTTPTDSESWLASAATLPAPPSGRARKAEALRAFRTQLEPLSDHPADRPVVPDALLQHVMGAPEVVLR